MATIINITRKRDRYDIVIGATERVAERHAYYDISTNEKIGVSGKAVKKFNFNAGNLLGLLMDLHEINEVREVCDRLISLPSLTYESKDRLCGKVLSYWGNSRADAQLILDHWKKFLEYAKEDYPFNFSAYLDSIALTDSIKFIKDEEFVSILQNNLNSYSRRSFAEMTKYKSFRKYITEQNKRFHTIKNNRAKLSAQGITIEVLRNEYGLHEIDIDNALCRNITTTIDKYKRADEMITFYKITDYEIIDIDNALRDLQSMRETRQNELFREAQTEHDLTYENDSYKVVVPTTRAELAQYGQIFGNCLNGFEWDNYLSRGTRYAVIVMDKANGTPVVCVDIDRTTKTINQYLGRYNAYIRDENQQRFQLEYQAYLNAIRKGE